MGTIGGAPARAKAAQANGGESAEESRSPVRDTIVALIEERPGVSVAEIAAVTKIAKPTVATTVSKLKRDGVLADEAGGVKLASRKPITLAEAAAAVVRDAGVSDAEWEDAAPKRKREGAAA
jgi:DeoR/GlpR family transcriptional regulator of sugar metabolism